MNTALRTTLLILLASLSLSACGGATTTTSQPTAAANQPAAVQPPTAEPPQPTIAGRVTPTLNEPSAVPTATNVRVGLDWTPNTNHTGLYVAQAQGLFAQQGLEVEILQAQEGGTVEQLVAAGRLDFGISYQEWVTQARVEGVPIVAVAAIMQHNTSGFASRASANIKTPADFAGKKYGAGGSPIERAVIQGLMECAQADASKVEFIDIGSTDFFVATERGDIDFAWIYKGWTGMEAEERGIPLNIVMMKDLNCIPDYYTPVLITSEKLIAAQPDVVRRFVHATSAGYQFAIANPEPAAEILLKAVPELDRGLVLRSQNYLSSQYQADAPRWGEQKLAVWRSYAEWMAARNLVKPLTEPERAFTNDFLP